MDVLGKKIGRPTDNPKTVSLKVMLDQDTLEMLEECVKSLGISKAEILRRGVREIYKGLIK